VQISAPYRLTDSQGLAVGPDRRKGRRLLPDILTLASHPTAGKDEPTRPGPSANAHYRLTTTPSTSPWVAVNTWVPASLVALLAQVREGPTR
jgi:hypothetical protein